MPSAEDIRNSQRETWARLSTGWDTWDSVIMEQLAPVGAAMIDRLDIAEDQHHLDIASGTGEPGLTIARLAPRGHVVLTDLVSEMLDVASRQASAQGITNVETRACSADDLPFDDASFENLWTSIALQAIASEVALTPPDPDGPGMFRCAAAGYVSALYVAAGLHEVAEWDVGVELVTHSPEEYWQVVSEHVSPVVAALGRVDEPARERIAHVAITRVSAYQVDGMVRVPGMARCIVGTK